MINAKGGILGKKIEIITEDNRSEPQEAVVGYRKMISSDNVQIFASGCVSAGNFAAAASVVRAKIPMVLCSILPRQPEEQKWAFSTLRAAALRGRGALSVPQGQDRRSARSASCTIRRPTRC